MSTDDPHVRDILLDAAELPAEQRPGFLDAACAGDPALRRHLQLLAERIDEDIGQDALDNRNAPADPHPANVGRYRIVAPIGEGGMGTVYRAEQTHPIRRTVALKLIKPGMDSRQVIARFEAERQALAMMDHVNIARVLDAGATEAGRPYFVMELVEGVRITSYCDDKGLGVRQRLELFVQVCQAVQHAHQKGIIHRDIKPSNVLVAELDGRPVPKVIDFGVAKATQGRLTEQTLTTRLPQWLGTPQYMSPEQADGTADVDTRADVYGLGVLLYELLTGLTPLDFGTGGYSEVQRVIREVEPPPPSARRGCRGLRGDLDRIVLKAMAKERSRRYETALGLALDVQRYLRHEPVTARQGTSLYRVRKLVRRNRLAFAIAAVVLVSLALAAARDLWQRRAIEDARADAVAMNRFLAEMLDSAGMFSFTSIQRSSPAGKASDTTVREMLDRAARRLDQGVLRDRPRAEAAARTRLAQTYRGLGLFAAAIEQFRSALAIQQRVIGQDDLEVAATWNDLGLLLASDSGMEDARHAIGEALRIRRMRRGDESREVAESEANLGMFVGYDHQWDVAEKLLGHALRVQRKLGGDDSLDVALTRERIGIVLDDKGDFAAAKDSFRECLRIRHALLEDGDPLVAEALTNLAIVLAETGELDDAEALHQRALSLFRARSLGDHPDVGRTALFLGRVFEARDDFARAETEYREALRIQKATVSGPDSDRNEDLVRVLLAGGQRAPASKLARDGVESDLHRVDVALSSDPNNPKLVAARGELLARLGKFDEALNVYDRAAALDPGNHDLWYGRGCLRLYLGQRERYRVECGEMLRRFGTTDNVLFSERIAKTCLLAPCFDDELPAIRRLAELGANEPPGGAMGPWLLLVRGMDHYRRGDYADAVRLLTASRDAFQGPRFRWHAGVDFYLAMAYQKLGDAARAREALATGVAGSERYLFQAGEGDLGYGGTSNWLICQIARKEAEAVVGD
jgi:tetratricopeptide (TPR) repeat protein